MFASRLGLRIFVVVATTSLASLAGCAADMTEDEETGNVEGAATASVNLKYEGTCEFLRSCSSYSRGLPVGQVTWGCTGVGICSDTALWVAGPTRSYCGKTVRICKGGTCTNALVKDVSVSRDWEASNGVMAALGLPHGLTGRCSGFGGGRVTVATTSAAPAPAQSSPRPDEDGSCFSSTLARAVPEKSCVESRSDGAWYQCDSGSWHGGVEGEGDTGPFGACVEKHPLP